MNDTSQRLPRPLRGLAMTDVVDGLRLGFDFLCHCEEAKPTRQSVLLAVCSHVHFLHGVRIAAASSKPRNDIRCTIVPLKSVPEGDTSILHFSFFIFPHPLWTVERILCTTDSDVSRPQTPVENAIFIHIPLWMEIP